ncbi:MAG: hypothetical protein COA36_10690 [Desulfotalea sp.]|nr:MAG: hypothetical protein COA36_10690 [Desulfotalea sp.]
MDRGSPIDYIAHLQTIVNFKQNINLMEENRMSTENAFNKRLTEETTMDQVEGLLEHFNLPPKTVIFIRKNQRIIQVFIGLLIAAVVAWALYGSYMEKQREEAATALSIALEKPAAEQATALSNIVAQYGRTSSSTWAAVELAHLDMKNGNFTEAAVKYDALKQKVDAENPLKPLVIYGLAQALEASAKYTEASSQYNALKEFKGFESIGYISLGRIEETQGNYPKAIAILNNFVLSVTGDPSFTQSHNEIEAKIARLKALQ